MSSPLSVSYFLEMVLFTDLCSVILLGWQTQEPQGSIQLCLPLLGFHAHTTTPDLYIGARDMNLGSRDCIASVRTTEPAFYCGTPSEHTKKEQQVQFQYPPL